MNNKGRNIHNSGPLGMLMQRGDVKKIDEPEVEQAKEIKKGGASYFKTQTGIEFAEAELVYVDPKECEPWRYANRQDDEMGNIDELIESIKTNKQLQPALIRPHSAPHDNVKYEIIFGRRRHIACSKLGIPFLAIRKDIQNEQDAIASQDAENKLRDDVSNYSNALLYQRLLNDKVFKSEGELARKLGLATSTFNDLMSYARIPADLAESVHNIHTLSKNLASTLVKLLAKDKNNLNFLLNLSAELGKTITSPAKLEKALDKLKKGKPSNSINKLSKQYKSSDGEKHFTFKYDQRGMPAIVFNKTLASQLNFDDLCLKINKIIESSLSGYPDE